MTDYSDRYNTVYKQGGEDDGYTFKQVSVESGDEYIVMERDASDVLEPERDPVQVLIGQVEGYLDGDH